MKEGTAKYAEIESGINATLSRKMKEKMMQKKNYESRFKVSDDKQIYYFTRSRLMNVIMK